MPVYGTLKLESRRMAVLPNETVSKITRLLVEAARPTRIILFGSHAKGEGSTDSDIDVMVVNSGLDDRLSEMVRLNRILRSIDPPVDLLVVSEEKFQYWKGTPGNVYFEAESAGIVLYEAA